MNTSLFVQKAREELCYNEFEPFTIDDISVLFTCFLENEFEQLIKQNKSDKLIDTLISRNVVIQFIEQIQKYVPSLPLKSILTNQDYLSRLKEIIEERIYSNNKDAPYMRIAPYPMNKHQMNELLGSRINYGLIFAAESIYFQDTVHAFQNDALSAGANINILGGHMDWLVDTGKSTMRALIVDNTGLVKDVKFEQPVKLDIVHILYLPQNDEIKLHKKISSLYKDNGIIQINPYEGGSARADNKMWSYKLWNNTLQNDITLFTPKTQIITQGTPIKDVLLKLKTFLKKIHTKKIVIQPNKGTEGKDVRLFSFYSTEIDEIEKKESIVQYIQHILSYDDVIIREERGNIKYFNPEEKDKGYRNITLRINVCWTGKGFVAESGYAQIAKDEQTFVTSPAYGGKIISINKAITNLYYPVSQEDQNSSPTQENYCRQVRTLLWEKIPITQNDIHKIKQSAVSAIKLLNKDLSESQYLKFSGVDVILEVGSSPVTVIPVILEANSRPAGLAQSYEITESKLKIATEFFNGIISKYE